MQKYKTVLICGSLRKCSTNRGLLRAIQKIKHEAIEFEQCDISEIPLFNQDVEQKGIPESVEIARKQIKGADAIIFAVPQNNFGVSAPLKNAYDWLSREYPNNPSPVQGIIAAMVSAAGGHGGATAQRHFDESVKFRKVKMLYETLDKDKRIQINRFQPGYFDENGDLTNAETEQKIKVFLNEFFNWIQKNKK